MAKETKAAAKKAPAAKKKETEAAAPKEKAAKTEKIAQNGITRPKKQLLKVWEEQSAKLKKPAPRAGVLEALSELNEATVATQYGRWRKFNGLKGRGTEAEAPAAA